MGELPAHLVLYDADCGLCDRTVQWLLKHDRDRLLTFAPLQGDTARRAREHFPEIPSATESIVFVDVTDTGRRVFLRSRGVFRICSYLPAPQRWLSWLRIIPSFISDIGYQLIAHNRFRIWGRVEQCRIPSPEERLRFLP